jgi:hypothetical protein
MLCVSISAGAVLKEKNLNSTLSVLRTDRWTDADGKTHRDRWYHWVDNG